MESCSQILVLIPNLSEARCNLIVPKLQSYGQRAQPFTLV